MKAKVMKVRQHCLDILKQHYNSMGSTLAAVEKVWDLVIRTPKSDMANITHDEDPKDVLDGD